MTVQVVRCFSPSRLRKARPNHAMVDGFTWLFDRQAAFAARVLPEVNELSVNRADPLLEKRRTELTQQLLAAISNELEELRGWTPWKHWKRYHAMSDRDRMELCYELVDVLHFWVELCLVWGFDARTVCAVYEDKRRQNHERQDRGYGHEGRRRQT